MLSPELVIFHCWGKTFLSILPLNNGFFQSTWWNRQALFLAWYECHVLFHLILLDDSFSGLDKFLHTLVLISNLLNSQDLIGSPKRFLFLFNFLFSGTLVALISPDSNFHLINSLRPPVSSRFLFSVPWPENFFTWGNYKIHPVCFPFLRDYCPSSPEVHCLENDCFKYFILFFIVLHKDIINLLPVTISH